MEDHVYSDNDDKFLEICTASDSDSYTRLPIGLDSCYLFRGAPDIVKQNPIVMKL